jgi:hypothetical protein
MNMNMQQQKNIDLKITIEKKWKQIESYLALGFSLIPLGKDKKPLLSWLPYQTQKADKAEIEKWLQQFGNDMNIGIVTGAISGIIVVDVEKDGSTADLTPTVIAKSGGGGWHYYYKHPGVEVKNATRIRELTDIRGDGGYVVAPPSSHPSGGYYEWVASFDMADLADLPEWVFNKKQQTILPIAKDWPVIAQGVSEGSRNEGAAKLTGKLLHDLSQELWTTAGWDAVLAWNGRNSPPLPEGELRAVFDSIAKSELSSRSNLQTDATVEKWKPALSIQELANTEFKKSEWIIDRLVPQNGITAFSSAPAMYKSYLLAVMAIACATGGKFLEKFQTKQTGVMVIDEENNKNRIGQRIRQLTDDFNLPIYYHIQDGFQVAKAGMVETVIQEAKEKNVGLIFFDTLVRIHGVDENSATEMNQVYQLLQKFTQAGITVVFTHHHKKQGRFAPNLGNVQAVAEAMRGSSDILGMVDAHLSLMAVKEEKEGKYLIAVQTKQRDDEILGPFKIKVESDTDSISFEHAGEYNEEKGALAEAKERILAELDTDITGISRKGLETLLEGIAGGTNIRNAIKELKTESVIVGKTRKQLKDAEVDKGEGTGKEEFYFLAEQPAQVIDSREIGLDF